MRACSKGNKQARNGSESNESFYYDYYYYYYYYTAIWFPSVLSLV